MRTTTELVDRVRTIEEGRALVPSWDKLRASTMTHRIREAEKIIGSHTSDKTQKNDHADWLSRDSYNGTGGLPPLTHL